MCTRYRVVEKTINECARPPQTTRDIVWEGTDILALSEEHPPSRIYDTLGRGGMEDDYITWSHSFEKFENGEWVACHDPRVRLNPELTDLEIEIQAENNRLYPEDAFEEEDAPDCSPEDLAEIREELENDARIDRQFIREWEQIKAKPAPISKADQRELGSIERHFGGVDHLLTRREFLSKKP